jgi:hypothetical protein
MTNWKSEIAQRLDADFQESLKAWAAARNISELSGETITIDMMLETCERFAARVRELEAHAGELEKQNSVLDEMYLQWVKRANTAAEKVGHLADRCWELEAALWAMLSHYAPSPDDDTEAAEQARAALGDPAADSGSRVRYEYEEE